MDVGKLTQPFVRLRWGGLDLTEYSAGGMRPQPIFYGVKVNLEKKDAAPTLEFNFSPSPIGFGVFVECKQNRIDEPIIVDIGYAMGDSFSLKFFYSGCSFSTGHDMGITVYAVSPIKSAWTNNRINFTMVEPVPLKDFPALVKEKCGEGCKDIKFEFVGKAADDSEKIEIKHAVINQTPHRIVVDIARANGMITSINPEGTLIIHYSYVYKDEKEADKPEVSTKPKYDGVIRNVFIAGPGLLNTFRRDQRFNVGQTTFDYDAAFTSPVAFEQDNKKVPDINTIAGESASIIPEAEVTAGQSAPSFAQSGTEVAAGSLKDARAAWAQASTTTGDGNFFMVPYLVGIKPRDILCIPSLNPDNPYFEDWIVENVVYEQMEEGGVEVGVSCIRPFPGEGLVLDEGSAGTVEGILAGLRTTKDWHALYWSVEPNIGAAASAQPSPSPLPNQAATDITRPEELQVIPFRG